MSDPSELDPSIFSAAISAAGAGADVELARAILAQMVEAGIEPTLRAYNSVLKVPNPDRGPKPEPKPWPTALYELSHLLMSPPPLHRPLPLSPAIVPGVRALLRVGGCTRSPCRDEGGGSQPGRRELHLRRSDSWAHLRRIFGTQGII